MPRTLNWRVLLALVAGLTVAPAARATDPSCAACNRPPYKPADMVRQCWPYKIHSCVPFGYYPTRWSVWPGAVYEERPGPEDEQRAAPPKAVVPEGPEQLPPPRPEEPKNEGTRLDAPRGDGPPLTPARFRLPAGQVRPLTRD